MKLCLFWAVLVGIVAAMFCPVPAEAGGVVIVTRKDIPAFDEVKNSFIQQSYVEQIAGLVSQAYYLDGTAQDSAVLKLIAEIKPDTVFAIGYYSAKKVRETLPGVPMVAAMIYYPEIDGMNLDPNMVIIKSLGSPKELMTQAKSFRKFKAVGLLHSSELASSSAASISDELKAQGVDILDFPVAKADEIASVFDGAKGKIQALVVLPDSISQNADSVRFIVTQSVAGDILPLSLNENIVSSGALFAVFYATDSIGRKGAQIVREIGSSRKIPADRLQAPSTTSSALNKGALQAFKLKVPSNLKIGVIYE
jgi:ABC-type uncharacterized transport system substrate-binding protein